MPFTMLARRLLASSARASAVFVLLHASPARAGTAHAIPPGQDRLVAEMLGRDQAVGPCRLVVVDMSPATIEASYGCRGDGGLVDVVLEYPSSEQGAAFITREFAVRARGAPPPELLDALHRRIAEREGEWRWADVGVDRFVEPNVSRPQPANGVQPGAAGGWWWLPPAASSAAMLLVVFVARARGRHDGSRSRRESALKRKDPHDDSRALD
jgi:hypothetical protein